MPPRRCNGRGQQNPHPVILEDHHLLERSGLCKARATSLHAEASGTCGSVLTSSVHTTCLMRAGRGLALLTEAREGTDPTPGRTRAAMQRRDHCDESWAWL